MRAEVLSKRYSGALLSLADKKSNLAEIDNDVTTLIDMLKVSPDFRRVVELPLVSASSKEAVISELRKKGYFSDMTCKFLILLARRGRLNYLSVILDSFKSMIFERRGVLVARATFPYKADAETVKRLTEKLGKMFGKEIHLTMEENPAIIGGVVVHVGSQVYDASILGKLEKLKVSI